MKEKRIEKSTKAAVELQRDRNRNVSNEDDESTELSEVKPVARDLADLHLQQNKSGTRRLRKTRYKEEASMIDKKELEKWRLDAIQRPLELHSTYEWSFKSQTELLGVPIRPSWKGEGLSTQKLHDLEEHAVNLWSKQVETKTRLLHTTINDFEQKISPWRCLWKILETCNMILVILDSRFPNFFYPYSLVKEARRCGILVVVVLNKTELNKYSSEWLQYFTSSPEYESDIHATLLVSARDSGSVGDFALNLERIVQQQLRKEEEEEEEGIGQEPNDDDDDDSEFRNDAKRVLRIGIVGHPNVGKSSLINGLMKCWSLERATSANPTPGRTQHNQTFQVLNKGMILEDCPGITFPILGLNLPLAVLMGSYSISQIREPLSVLRFLLEYSGGAEMLLGALKLMSGIRGGKRAVLDLYGEEEESMIGPWTPHLTAECVAVRRNIVGRGGRPDVHAVCLHLIKKSFLGEIPSVAFKPPSVGLPPAPSTEVLTTRPAAAAEQGEEEEKEEAEEEAAEEEEEVRAAELPHPMTLVYPVVS